MKGRFRKGKKALQRADLWLVHFGFGWEGNTPRQVKLAKRYIKFSNQRLDQLMIENGWQVTTDIGK